MVGNCSYFPKALLSNSWTFDGIMHSWRTGGRHRTVSGTNIEADVFQFIYTEIEKLPHRSKLIFKLCYLEGLSVRDIADMMKISPQTVANQKHTNAAEGWSAAGLAGNPPGQLCPPSFVTYRCIIVPPLQLIHCVCVYKVALVTTCGAGLQPLIPAHTCNAESTGGK